MIYRAYQEAPLKTMQVDIQGFYSSEADKDSLRALSERFVASVNWLSAFEPNDFLMND